MDDATKKKRSENAKKAAAARWKLVPTSDRKSHASKLAHARWKEGDVLLAEAPGVITLGGLTMTCAVLSDGRRVVSERSISDALEHARHPSDYQRKREQQDAFGRSLPAYVGAEHIAQFLSPSAREKLSKPIRYRLHKGFGIPAVGVEATLLGDICDAYVSAREAGVLRPEDLPKADAAMRLMRALAKVAIVALIDEATGYQVRRSRDELQRLLEQYVSEEHRPWAKVFPDEFYVELFRLRGVNMDDVRKRPSYFGHLTNDIVYSRILPGMLPRLRTVNPADELGRRRRTHTQHLSASVGEQHLRTHLAGVVMLMKAHNSYDEFLRALDRAAPKLVEAPSEPTEEA